MDYGGEGPAALLLHGLAGTALEWTDTAAWLTETHRVIAPDQRGHGRSERHPPSASPYDLVDDVLAIIEQLGLRSVTLIGQSFGGQTAFLAAARLPAAVRALIVVEASPAPADAQAVEGLRTWLDSWPVPFASRDEAQQFFGGGTLYGRAWAGGLEERDGGWWPAFDTDLVVRMLAETVGQDYWREWESIAAPALIVRGSGGWLGEEEAEQMGTRLRGARLVTVPAAGHDVHLDAPEEWRRAVEDFLSPIPPE